ncbi:hypothetical protein GQ55_2G405000 [Panicum hallii var. hallii]|uniref:Uncharacterized protein n=1 Tax=Panicum hallii var. hallii TaxID=1504633 RepID=A0A2T7EXM1_9POAL|nr:hypothetical protein GQ55_2G405000 [Panicum hallii var. hallii]
MKLIPSPSARRTYSSSSSDTPTPSIPRQCGYTGAYSTGGLLRGDSYIRAPRPIVWC